MRALTPNLDSANSNRLLIEVAADWPSASRMGARPNPTIRSPPRASRQVEQTIRGPFGAAESELDPRGASRGIRWAHGPDIVAVPTSARSSPDSSFPPFDFASRRALGEITFRDVRATGPVGRNAPLSLIVSYPVGMRLPVLRLFGPCAWCFQCPTRTSRDASLFGLPST